MCEEVAVTPLQKVELSCIDGGECWTNNAACNWPFSNGTGPQINVIHGAVGIGDPVDKLLILRNGKQVAEAVEATQSTSHPEVVVTGQPVVSSSLDVQRGQVTAEARVGPLEQVIADGAGDPEVVILAGLLSEAEHDAVDVDEVVLVEHGWIQKAGRQLEASAARHVVDVLKKSVTEAVGSRGEAVEDDGPNAAVISGRAGRAGWQGEGVVVHGVRTEDDGQVLAVSDLLKFGNDNAARLLEQRLVVPTRVDAA